MPKPLALRGTAMRAVSSLLMPTLRRAGRNAKRRHSGGLASQRAALSSLSEPAYLTRPFKDIPRSIGDKSTAQSCWEQSCYYKIDFKIPETSMMYEAVQRFAAYNVGALAVTNAEGKVIGVVSERDYVCKVSLLGRSSKTTPIKEVCTRNDSLVVALTTDSIEMCMRKMLAKDIRHLPVVDPKSGDVVGLLSIKDLIKELIKEKDEIIKVLSDINVGRGAFFSHF